MIVESLNIKVVS